MKTLKSVFFFLTLFCLNFDMTAQPQASLYYSINSAQNPFMAIGTESRRIDYAVPATLNNFLQEPTHASFQWALEDAGDGWYFIKILDRDLYLNMKTFPTGVNFRAELQPFRNANSFKFRIVSAGGKYSYIIPRINTRLRLGLQEDSTVEGTRITMVRPSTSRSQKWQFIPISKPRKLTVVLESIGCAKVDDPGDEVEVFGKIRTYALRDRTTVETGTFLFNRPAKSRIDLRRGQIFPVGTSYNIELNNREIGRGKIYFDLVIDLFEHDGSSANEVFEFGDHWKISDGFNHRKTARMEVEGSILLVNWLVKIE